MPADTGALRLEPVPAFVDELEEVAAVVEFGSEDVESAVAAAGKLLLDEVLVR